MRQSTSSQYKSSKGAKIGLPNRKAKALLDSRVADYAAMVSRVGWKANEGAFHQPGSMQGPR
jgi:hypothetical protein